MAAEESIKASVPQQFSQQKQEEVFLRHETRQVESHSSVSNQSSYTSNTTTSRSMLPRSASPVWDNVNIYVCIVYNPSFPSRRSISAGKDRIIFFQFSNIDNNNVNTVILKLVTVFLEIFLRLAVSKFERCYLIQIVSAQCI